MRTISTKSNAYILTFVMVHVRFHLSKLIMNKSSVSVYDGRRGARDSGEDSSVDRSLLLNDP